jgi:hypothetical protein
MPQPVFVDNLRSLLLLQQIYSETPAQVVILPSPDAPRIELNFFAFAKAIARRQR